MSGLGIQDRACSDDDASTCFHLSFNLGFVYRQAVRLLEVLQNEVIIEEGEVTAEATSQRCAHCTWIALLAGLCRESWLPGGSVLALFESSMVCSSRQCVMAIAKT